MDTLKALTQRRSCKKFQPDKLVSEADIEKIVEAGSMAANGKGAQAPVILAVLNKEVRDELSKLNAGVMGAGEDFDPFYGAPQVIVVLGDKSVPTYVYDGALVMGNMMTACEELGIDACWIHRAKQVFASEEGQAILKKAGIEGDLEGIGNLVIGYDEGTGKKDKAPRKDGYIYYIK